MAEDEVIEFKYGHKKLFMTEAKIWADVTNGAKI